MKKKFVSFLSGIVPAVTFFVNVNAQAAKSPLELSLKEFIFNEARAHAILESDGVTVNTRAAKDFNRRFGYTGKADWFEIRNGFAVRFETDGIDIKAYYDQEGRWYATIRTYSQDKMPKDVRAQVRSIYYDYTIYQVVEITVMDKLVYLVKIEDDTNFKTIRVTNTEMDTYEDFKKG